MRRTTWAEAGGFFGVKGTVYENPLLRNEKRETCHGGRNLNRKAGQRSSWNPALHKVHEGRGTPNI